MKPLIALYANRHLHGHGSTPPPVKGSKGPLSAWRQGVVRAQRITSAVRSRARRLIDLIIETPLHWTFNQRFVAVILRREHVLCLGDSHVRVLRKVRVSGMWFHTKPLSGATASGILNPNSATHSLSTFSALLQTAKLWQQILFQLGEVDCGFVIWHRAQRHGLSIDEQMKQTVDTYTAFLAKVARLGFHRVIVLSAPLPTISDYPSRFAEVANLRKEVTASIRERTELTLRFNDALQNNCTEIGVVFVDVTTGQLDRETGLVDQRFMRNTDQDHHLADKPYANLIASQMRWLGR